MRDRLHRWLAAVSCVLLLVLGTAPAWAADGVAFTWSDPRIATPVGLAADADHGVYWVANSGGSASNALYAVRADGRTAARLVFNLPSTDVQAVAYQGGKVYLADVGDPNLNRKYVTVGYTTVTALTDATVTYRAVDFTYPDGPHHAEAILVGTGGQLYLVTAGASPGIYEAPAQPVTTRTNQLTRVADAPADVTDGTFLPSGRVALRTKNEVYELDSAWQTVASAALPAQENGKSLGVSLDASSLLVGGQGIGTKVLMVRFPSQGTPSPEATPSPTPSETATAAPVQERSDQSGTRIALLAAALLAVIAGAYTLIRR